MKRPLLTLLMLAMITATVYADKNSKPNKQANRHNLNPSNRQRLQMILHGMAQAKKILMAYVNMIHGRRDICLLTHRSNSKATHTNLTYCRTQQALFVVL